MLEEFAAARFFSIPELIDHLIEFLDTSSIINLMQTNRLLNLHCLPTRYFFVSKTFIPLGPRLFNSPEPIKALSRNVHHVRSIHIQLIEVAYYFNSFIVYQELVATQSTNHNEHQVFTRPLWLPLPDPRHSSLYPIPPITYLTSLDIFDQASYGDTNHALPSYWDPKATLAQICWILDLNKHSLEDVYLRSVVIKDYHAYCLLVTSIFGLERLKNLYIWIFYWNISIREELPEMLEDLFFACPPTLQYLSIGSDEDPNASILHTDEYYYTPSRLLPSWEKGNEECGLTAMPRRQEPLVNLETLKLGNFFETKEEEFYSVLPHCSNLIELEVPLIIDNADVFRLAKNIACMCPKLRRILHSGYSGDSPTTFELMIRLLGELSPQQMIEFDLRTILDSYFNVIGSENIGNFFRGHSSTLRSITSGNCLNFDSKAIQTILVNCEALEVFVVKRSHHHNYYQICISLEDAIMYPWACSRLLELTLTVAIPGMPLHSHAEDTIPYYKRISPIILATEEKELFKALEVFYRQIGNLIELTRLDLRAIFMDPLSTGMGTRKNLLSNSFPAMLNLGCEETGRPGYLHLLGGLKKLKTLLGSVCATTEENMATIGMDEVVWMNKHWLSLERAHFFTFKKDQISPPFNWFIEQRSIKNLDIAVGEYC